jgi:hypothetical protein
MQIGKLLMPVLLLALSATSGRANDNEADIVVKETFLLSSVVQQDGRITYKKTRSIPYIAGRSCYNWVIRFHKVKGEVVFQEQLTLPAPAPLWGVSPQDGTNVANNRASAITERRFDGALGTATAGWCVAEGDPVGTHNFTVRQRGRVVAQIDFTVGDLI